MTNKEKLIEIYNKALESGEIERNGLCNCLYSVKRAKKNIQLFRPTKEISKEYFPSVYWGSGYKTDKFNIHREFTPLRQTILAFLIAMEE